MSEDIYTRVKRLCDERGITIKQMERDAGIGINSVGKWKRGVSPSIESAIRVAQFFHISLDYLMGLSDIRESADHLLEDPDLMSIQRARENLSPKDRKRMLALLRVGFDHAFEDADEKSVKSDS